MTFLDQVAELFNVFLERSSVVVEEFATATLALLLFVLNSMIGLLGGPF